jgi:hypothetical protein
MRIYLAFVFCAALLSAQAQDSKTHSEDLNKESEKLRNEKYDTLIPQWRTSGTINISGQQVSLTNWAAGGQSAISGNGLISLYAGYISKKHFWSNNLDLAYGVIKQASNRKWWKNDDRIQFTSKYGFKAFDHVYYTALVDFKSQFAAGYNYPNDSARISNFMAPAYVVAALGFDYRPHPAVSFFIAPATARITFVNDDTLAKYGAFGVQKEVRDVNNGHIITPYKKIREQFGGYFKMVFKKTVMENVDFGTTLELFSDYLHNPQDLYVNWTTLVTMKVNKYISATLSTQMIYDEAVMIKDKDGKVGPRLQFKQVLGVGLAYKF